MSLTYFKKGQLIFTGGHDGSLIAWSLENNQSKMFFHDVDRSCVSSAYIKDSKSVDCIIVLKRKKLLLSVSADNKFRFWDLSELNGMPCVAEAQLEAHDSVSAVATTMLNEWLVAGDTSGNIKLWSLKGFKFRKGAFVTSLKEEWFVNAHALVINGIQTVEAFAADKFIISCSNDHNINLHRLSTGQLVGQFGNDRPWDIHDLSKTDLKRPKYVRSWYLKKKKEMKEGEGSQEKKKKKVTIADDKYHSSSSLEEAKSHSSEDDDNDQLFMGSESSDSDSDPNTIKGAAQYMKPYKSMKQDRIQLT